MLGMTLALRLARRARRSRSSKRRPSGGLAGAWSLGDVVGIATHVTLLSDTVASRAARRIGFGEEMRWVETRTGFYTVGELHSMSNT